MPSLKSATLVIQEKGKDTVAGQVPVEFTLFSEQERTKRALKVSGLCVLGAVCAIPFPLVHFFAVPGFLILAPILGLRAKGMEGTLAEFQLPCPNCGKPMPVYKREVSSPFQLAKYSFDDVCNECGREWSFSGPDRNET
jgi:hypothetical protein